MIKKNLLRQIKAYLLRASVLSLLSFSAGISLEGKIKVDPSFSQTIPNHLWSNVIFSFSTADDKFNAFCTAKNFSGKVYYTEDSSTAESQEGWGKKYNQLKIEKETYKTYLTEKDENGDYVSFYQALDSIYWSTQNLIDFPSEIIPQKDYGWSQTYWHLHGCCLDTKASVTRTQAIKLLKLSLSFQAERHRGESKAFTLLFIRYLQSQGSEQIRDLLKHVFSEEFEESLRNQSSQLAAEYERYISLLQSMSLSLINFATIRSEDLYIISCFHPQIEIRRASLIQLNNRLLKDPDILSFGPLCELPLAFSAVINGSNIILDLLKNEKNLPSYLVDTGPYLYLWGNQVIQQDLLNWLQSLMDSPDPLIINILQPIYKQGNEFHQESLRIFLARMIHSQDSMVRSNAAALINIRYQQAEKYHHPALNKWLKELSQTTDIKVKNSVVFALSSIYEMAQPPIRQSITEFFKEMALTENKELRITVGMTLKRLYEWGRDPIRNLIITLHKELSQSHDIDFEIY